MTIPAKYLKPVVNREDDPMIQALFRAMKAKWPTQNIRLSRMSGATDGWYFSRFGLPTVVFTAVGRGAHAVDESGSLSSLDEYAEMFTAFILAKTADGRPAKEGK